MPEDSTKDATVYLTLDQFAERLQISRQRAYLLCRDGKMPEAFKVGSHYRIDIAAFEKRIEDERNAALVASD